MTEGKGELRCSVCPYFFPFFGRVCVKAIIIKLCARACFHLDIFPSIKDIIRLLYCLCELLNLSLIYFTLVFE